MIRVSRRHIDWDVSKEMFAALRGNASPLVLDVGSGSGEKACYVADGCGALICVERSSRCHESFSVVADATLLPFRDHSFDAVTMFHVIEHITEAEMAVAEIRRVLKRNGFCILVTPNSRRLTKLYSGIVRLLPWRKQQKFPMNADHVFEYAKPDLDQLMAGFGEYHIDPLFLGVIFTVFGRVVHIGVRSVPEKLSKYCNQWVLWARNDQNVSVEA